VTNFLQRRFYNEKIDIPDRLLSAFADSAGGFGANKRSEQSATKTTNGRKEIQNG
jgi:hypothetical protein